MTTGCKKKNSPTERLGIETRAFYWLDLTREIERRERRESNLELGEVHNVTTRNP